MLQENRGHIHTATARMTTVLTLCFLLLVPLMSACAPVADDESAVQPSDSDDSGETPTSQIGNQPPEILKLEVGSSRVSPGGETWVGCTVYDADGDSIRYEWGATGGSFDTPPGKNMTWIAPERKGEWVITLTATDPAGNTATESLTVTVGENKTPLIHSVEPSSASVVGGHSALITCVAEDPEGQPLDYAWNADCGELTGDGSRVTWFAPVSLPGSKHTCTITVSVDDGEGGIAVASVVIPVEFPHMVEEFTPVLLESGTACTDGTTTNSRARAGDDNDNNGYRAFWTYDLYRLKGTEVVEATLVYRTAFVAASQQALDDNNPFNKPRGLGTLNIYQVRFEPGGLPSYDVEPLSQLTETGLWGPPIEIDATMPVQRIGEGSATDNRLQVMAAFQRDSNKNMFAEYITWDSVILRVSYIRE